MMQNYKPDGEKLKRLREDRGLSLKDVAAAIDVDYRHIGKWESMEARHIHLDKFCRLADFYGYEGRSVMDLMIGENEPDMAPNSPVALIYKLALSMLTPSELTLLRSSLPESGAA